MIRSGATAHEIRQRQGARADGDCYTMSKWVKFLAFSCPHFNRQDDEAINWMHSRITHHAPDVVVHLGDGHEAVGASRFQDEDEGDEYDGDLKAEMASHNYFLQTTREIAERAAGRGRKVRCVFIPGNHDDNILAPGRINPKIRALCDYRLLEDELRTGKWEQPCQYVHSRNRGTFSLGAVTFAHGYECGQNSDELQSILLSRYTHGLFVSGHTHRPMHVQRARKTQAVPLPFWYANAGCLRKMKPGYVARKRTHGWGQAVVVGNAQLINSPRVTKQWDAVTEIFRMSDDL